MDEIFCGAALVALTGPFRDTLASYGPVLGFVVGDYAKGGDKDVVEPELTAEIPPLTLIRADSD